MSECGPSKIQTVKYNVNYNNNNNNKNDVHNMKAKMQHLSERIRKVLCIDLPLAVFAFLLVFFTFVVRLDAQQALPGWVIPERAELPVGSNLNITCTINKSFSGFGTNESCNVSDLYFRAINEEDKIFNGTQLQYINDTTIQMSFKNMSDQEGQYLCMCKRKGINTSHVDVGTKPLEVEDFNCTSYDWDYMFCNFTAPRNSINTKYIVSFATQKNSFYRYTNFCNYDASPTVNCNITSEIYKKFSEMYFFRVERSNSLGNDTQEFVVNNVERMILARPGQNLRVLNKTKDSICLIWDMPRRSNFIGGVLWQVHVTPENFQTLVRSMWRNSSSAAKDTLCLTELPYPGYNYVLELRVRNNKTKSRWSEPLEYHFRTAPERPARPPRLTNGSFYVYSSGSSLTIYWEQLQQHEFNGNNFTYVISSYRNNNTKPDSSIIKLDTNSATIQNWSQNAYHEIFIRSRNNVNISVDASRLYIPPISDEDTHFRVPKKIRSIYISSNSSYRLSWTAPENTTNLIDYTVYWCNAKPALLSKCNGSLHFEHVSKDQLQYSTDINQSASLNMAVSANYEDRNTGMHWMTCTSDGNDDLAKMDPTIDEVSNTSLVVKWSTERVCPVILAGYNLTYCQRSAGKADNCTTIVLNKDVIAYTIEDLEPYTYYGVRMLMFSDNRYSKYSDELIKRTDEGAPTAPRQLECLNVSNSRVMLAWKPPLKANGVVREYRGTYRYDNKTGYFDLRASTDELVDNEKLIYFELANLTAFTSYTISLRARTVLYSEPSNVVHIRTAVGVPSPPTLTNVDNKQLSTTLEWTAPQLPAGRLEYYEVVIIERNFNNTIIGQPLSYVSARPNLTCVMATPVCTPLHRFHYQVRAVNAESISLPQAYAVDTMPPAAFYDRVQRCVAQPPLTDSEWRAIRSYNNNSLYRLYKSSWAMHEVSCSPDRSNAQMLLKSLEAMLALIVIGVACHTGYRKYQKMSDIGVMLPTGVIEDLKKPKDMVLRADGNHHGGGGGGGIICTQIDPTPDYLPQYSLHDPPHDFSSGNESSKLLLANNSSSGGCGAGGRSSPASYMSMDQGLLLYDEGHGAGQATELQPNVGNNNRNAAATAANANVNSNANTNSNANANTGYIKPTQMKNWSTPMPNNLPSMQSQMPLSGYVPVQVMQARPNAMPAAAPVSNVPAVHPLNTSNYVQAADLHKLKPLSPITSPTTTSLSTPTPTTTPTFNTATTDAAAAATSPTTLMTNDFGYTSMEQLQRDGLMKPVAPMAHSAQQQLPTAADAVAAAANAAAVAAGAAAAATTPTTTPTTAAAQHRLQPNIGGYVTPQDLNALAHNRHML